MRPRVTAFWWALTSVFGASFVFIWLLSGGGRSVMFDSFRDMAWARNIAGGLVWSDPVLAGEPFWYAPGNPLIFGLLSNVLRVDVVDVYRTSPLWWNVLIPIMVFLVVYRAAGVVAAILAVPMVFVGSLWWLTHGAAVIPSIQATLLGLSAFLPWRRCLDSVLATEGEKRGLKFAWITGFLIASTAWIHPVCAMVTAAAIGFQTLYGVVFPRLFDGAGNLDPDLVRSRLGRALIHVAIPSFLLSAPLMIHFFNMPIINRVPLDYIAPELLNPDFALQAHTALLPIFAVLGVAIVLRLRPMAAWIVGYLAAGAIGQAAGYASRLGGLHVPYLLPHEFQWHTQLAFGITAAIAMVDISERLARRIGWPTDPHLARFLWIGLMVGAVVSPVIPYLEIARNFQVDIAQIEAANSETREWILNNTSLDSVFATDPLNAYLAVSGLTGRKCVAVPIGHMNPGTDARRRLTDLSSLLTTEDEIEFTTLVRLYGVTHLLIRLSSPEAHQHAQALAGFSCLRPRHLSTREGVIVYEVQS